MRLSWSAPNRHVGFLDVLGGLGAVGLLVARFIPVARILPFWGCPLREATGWPCPGCGLTRAADHLAHGQLGAAGSANPLGTVAGLAFAGLALFAVVHLAFGTRVPQVELQAKEARRLRWAVAISAVLNYAWVVAKVKL